ncbi:MAG: translesion error-prone DNA polymerase V autoproteolytic subunit [Nitrosospira sp.]|nr:translesion error-prone DNA polymerase V autoproteolytic subunit [Nitrosospira sp.]
MTTGFASPADDFLEGQLSLDKLLVHNKDATFFVRAEGVAMVDVCIQHGDLLVVDRSLSPISGNIVIAVDDGDLIVRRFIQHEGRVVLAPENSAFKELEFKDGQELKIWGVVTSLIKKLD